MLEIAESQMSVCCSQVLSNHIVHGFLSQRIISDIRGYLLGQIFFLGPIDPYLSPNIAYMCVWLYILGRRHRLSFSFDS